MKTSFNIADPLLKEARELAARDSITLRELVEQGLRMILNERRSAKPFKLRNASFKGKGLQDEFKDATWEEIRAAIYNDRDG